MADVKISALTAASAAAKSMLIAVVEDPAGTPVSKKLSITQLLDLDDGTKTASAPLINMAQTWNSGGVTFTAMKINVTNTASAGSSLLIDLQIGGVSKFKVRSDGAVIVDGTVSAYYFYSTTDLYSGSDTGALILGSAGDTILARDAANTLAQRNGTAAQSLRIYNTYTDASNYERGVFDWGTTSNVLTIGTQKAGTGSTRNIEVVVGGVRKLDYGITFISWWSISESLFVGNSLTASGAITGHPSYSIGWSGATLLHSSSDGVLRLTDNAGTDFDRLQLGGTTSSFPAIKRVSAGLKFVVADDSASAAIEALTVSATSNGSTSAPSFVFSGRGADTGIYSASSTSIGFTIAGSVSHRFFSDGSIYTYNDASSLTFGAATDLSIFRDAANTLAQRNGTAAQAYRLYNTYTDASNYERGGMYWSGNTFYIGAQAGGTGSARVTRLFSDSGVLELNDGNHTVQLTSSGFVGLRNLLFATDNTYDIGASGATRPRNGYFGGSLTTGAPNTGTAAAWKLGTVVTAAVTPDTTRYIELDVAGTLYKLIVAS